jgi:hypothetical protein
MKLVQPRMSRVNERTTEGSGRRIDHAEILTAITALSGSCHHWQIAIHAGNPVLIRRAPPRPHGSPAHWHIRFDFTMASSRATSNPVRNSFQDAVGDSLHRHDVSLSSMLWTSFLAVNGLGP